MGINAPEETYVPSPWGLRFHSACNADGTMIDEILGAGAAGPGKSFALRADPLAQIFMEHSRCDNEDHPHPIEWGKSVGWGLYLRRQNIMLDHAIARAQQFFPLIDPKVVWSVKGSMFIFSSGYKLQYGHCNDVGDYNRYQSNEYTHIGFDELIQFEEIQYTMICMRLRTDDPVLMKMLKVRACSNPTLGKKAGENFSVSDPQWVRKYFVDPCPKGNTIIRREIRMGDGSVKHHTRAYLPATLYDNPNKAFVESYERQLRVLPPHIQQVMLYGDWYRTVDSYYGHVWDKSVHVVKPFVIPDSWRWFRSMDWGFKAPGIIGWWALSPDGDVYLVHEHNFQGKYAADVAKDVLDVERSYGLTVGLGKRAKSTISGPSDTQLWEQRGDDVTTKADIFAAEGVTWDKASKASRQRNAELLMERLDGAMKGKKGVYFFDDCVKSITCIPSINTKKNAQSEEPEDGGDDHAHDMVLYAMAHVDSGVKAPTAARSASAGPDEDDDDDPAPLRPVRSGRYGYGSSVA